MLGHLASHVQQLIRGLAHGADDDADAGSLVLAGFDESGDGADFVDVGNGGASVFLHDGLAHVGDLVWPVPSTTNLRVHNSSRPIGP